jgi:hypothetical protein
MPEPTERWTRGDFTRGAPEGLTVEKKWQKGPECNNGIRNKGLKERLCLGSRRTLNKIFRHTVELEVAKQIVRTSITLKNECQDIVEGFAPSETKQKTAHRLRSWRYKSIDHSWIFCLHRMKKKDDGDTPGPTGTL